MWIIHHLNKYTNRYLFASLFLLSFASNIYFYSDGKHLLYGDALSRLNISRKLTDNLTPGIGQLGNVWLPLPQVLMMPFTANEFLWHSGVAGTLVSSAFFIVGSIALYKAIFLLTNSKVSSWTGLAILTLNINLLYLQSTAMSESAFIGLLCLFTYYLVKWTKEQDTLSLLSAGVCLTSMTLVRYEGLAVLFAGILFVGVYSFFKTKSFKKTEGRLVLFGTLAVAGFMFWTLYLTVIFGDPLYWKNYYVDVNPAPATAQIVHKPTENPFYAGWWYFTSVVWMNGIIPVLLSLFGSIYMLYISLRRKSFDYFPIFLHLSIFVFMILTLMRNTPINQPQLGLNTIFTGNTNHFNEFNIRYGILMLPFVAITVGVLVGRSVIFAVIVLLLFSVQLLNYAIPTYSSLFQFNVYLEGNIAQGGYKSKEFAEWFRKNYDGGLILVSAEKHDSQMFQLGVKYKTFIHEGTNYYWKDSLKMPSKYAKWIITDYDDKNPDAPQDKVAKAIRDNPDLKDNFTLVYKVNDRHVYKAK